MDMHAKITAFLSSPAFGVLGASTHREKYGNKVLRCYLQHHRLVYPLNPHADEIEGISVIKKIADLPDTVKSISIITPPNVTEELVKEAIAKNIKNIWMQPGAESEAAIQECIKHHINVIAGGICILVVMNFHEA